MINGLVWSMADVERRKAGRAGKSMDSQLADRFNDVFYERLSRGADGFEELAQLVGCGLALLADIEEQRAR